MSISPNSLADILRLAAQPAPTTLPRLDARIERGWRLGLDGMRRTLERLGEPSYPVVLVGGTNGKGSVCAHLHQIFASTLTVGLTTSPHLCDVRERIRVDDEFIEAEDFDRLFEEVVAADEDGSTYFETIALMAIRHFQRRQVDLAVIEIGMGGRFDAFNVLDPAVSVITSVGLEHTQWLGDTVEKIAAEKAPIARPGRPCVLGCDLPVLREEVEKQGARVVLGEPEGVDVDAQNRATALAAARALALIEGWSFDEVAARDAMARTRWPGRFDLVRAPGPDRPGILFDAAHNPHAAAALCTRLREYAGTRRVVGLVAFLRDKDVPGFFVALDPAVESWVVTEVQDARALPATDTPRPYNAEVVTPLAEAFAAAEREAGPEGLVVVTGSIYLLGDFLRDKSLASIVGGK